MCGLAGIVAYGEAAPPVDERELLAMRERMAPRGPDGAGNWLSGDGRAGFGHRRLAIIDLSPGGAQPMASPDGRHVIVFNGEIYNYRALRDELKREGFAFRTDSDTEVLLQLYARDGDAMCRKLRGMYAFAIWDTRESTVFLARDPFGIKPLYLHDDGRTLRFASQVKALAAGGIARDTEPAAVVGFWIWGHVPEPWTLYRDAVSLPAGSWLKVFRNGRRASGVFDSVAAMLLSGASEMPLREALLDTVRHHLVADVPVGVFLSGGIDSASLVALAAEQGQALRTVTLGFEEYRGTPDDEAPLAEEVARTYGTRHETVWLGRRDFESALQEFLDAMDQPSTDGLNTWLVARAAAHAGLKVAISGLGGDELFGGYPSFRQLPWMRRLSRPFGTLPFVGRAVRKAGAPLLRRVTSEKFAGLLEYGASWEGAYLLRRATRMPWEVQRASGLDPEFVALGLRRLAAAREGDARLEVLGGPGAIVSYLESTRYMRGRLLRDADWAGMAHSLEIRVPLVDAVFARHVAAARRRGRPYRKADLAAAAHPPLPQAVARRPKTGFTVPVRDWMLEAGTATRGERGLRAWQATVAGAFGP